MNQRQLECAVTTARLGSSTKAAGELFTTQPTVAYQITTLEKELGVALFSRDAHGMRLTSAGEKILPVLERALASLRDAADTARHVRHEGKATVTVMHFQHIHDPLFDNAIRQFRNENPDISVRYTTTVFEDALSKTEADVQIMPRMAASYWPENMHREVLFKTRLYAIVSEASPLSSHKSVSIEDLADHTVVFLGKPVMEALDAWYIERAEQLKREGFLQIEYASERTLQSIQYRMLGDETLVFPSQGIHTNLTDGLVLVPFSDGELLEQYICWADRTGREGTAIEAFVGFMRSYYRDHAEAFA